MHVAKAALREFSINFMDVVTYPPNATDVLQGLDVCLFGPLKGAYEKEIKRRTSLRLAVTKHNLPE